jgi:hypothetical protein
MDAPQAFYGLILSPTRELAIQIAEQVEALGAAAGVRCAALVGGVDIVSQAVALARRPHVVVGTPGRVVDHLSNTKVRERGKRMEKQKIKTSTPFSTPTTTTHPSTGFLPTRPQMPRPGRSRPLAQHGL